VKNLRSLLSSACLWAVVATSLSCGGLRSGVGSTEEHESFIAGYIEAWKNFYPDRAAALGLDAFADRAADRSPEGVGRWLAFNDSVLVAIARAPATLPLDVRIDLRLIRRQGRAEAARWGREGRGSEEDAGAPSFPLGREAFEAELRLYYDMDLTPEEVAEWALAEIRETRRLMAETSAAHWRDTRGEEPMPAEETALVAWALAAMEENRPGSQQESLEVFTRFAHDAEAFVREAGIATLPQDRALEIVLTPPSAGPAQRIGFVEAAPPFDSTAITVLSLPTIEDTFPAQEKEDFYRSFNNHFNKAIIIHELFPGHYMQGKINAGNPRPTRIFFPYEPFIEGWATLVERIALDAGWDNGNRLTFLAHLRKRLENANRAYASVQAHCFGWTEEEVLRFSQEEALLAPQFAKSLWGRLERGPMQMTSYFLGGARLRRVLDAERARLGGAFDMRAFTDALLRAGPIPLDLIPEVLAGG
jgi:uncharacterized protein (DUF885 family)